MSLQSIGSNSHAFIEQTSHQAPVQESKLTQVKNEVNVAAPELRKSKGAESKPNKSSSGGINKFNQLAWLKKAMEA